MFRREREALLATLAEAQRALKAADVEAANGALRRMSVLLESVEELVDDIDRVVEQVPKDWQKVVAAALALLEKGVAAGGHFGELAQKVTQVVMALRDGAWVEVQDLSFGGQLKISGRLRMLPKAG